MNKLLLFCLLSPSLFASTTFLDWWSFRILIHQTNWTGTSFAEMDLSALLDNSHHIMLLVQLCEHPKDHKAEQSDCPESSLRLGGLKQQLLPKVNDRQNDLRSSDTISSWCLSSGVAPAPADSSDQPESLLHVCCSVFPEVMRFKRPHQSTGETPECHYWSRNTSSCQVAADSAETLSIIAHLIHGS